MLNDRHLLRVSSRILLLRVVKNAEKMASEGSLDTNEMVKCKMTFKGSIYRGIYSYKAFIKRSSKLAATIQKRNLKSCGNTSRGAQT